MKFNERQREILAEKLADLGNIAVGSLIFGYVVRAEIFNSFSLILGIVISITMYWFAVRLTKE